MGLLAVRRGKGQEEAVSDKLTEYRERYMKAMHAVQSGVAMEIESGHSGAHEPKHLRVGINSAMVTDRAVACLLIAKGLVTAEEYYEAVAVAAEHEARLSSCIGMKVNLV